MNLSIKWSATRDILLRRPDGIYDTNNRGTYVALIASVCKLPEGTSFDSKLGPSSILGIADFESEPFELKDLTEACIDKFLYLVKEHCQVCEFSSVCSLPVKHIIKL